MKMERSQDVYEHVEHYPKPPLIQMSEPDDISTVEELGINLTPFSRRVIHTAMLLTGYKKFLTQLPENLEEILRKSALRLPGLFLPVISATAMLQDDQRSLSPVERAVTVIFAMRSFYEDLFEGKFQPDQSKGEPLEMGQYPNLFGTSLVIDGNKAKIYKTSQTNQVTVIVHRRFYLLDIGIPGVNTTFEQLVFALERIISDAGENIDKSDHTQPGLLTCCNNKTQFRIFNQLVGQLARNLP
jgi:hypothetical protein